MKVPLAFSLIKKDSQTRARVGIIHTLHGDILTPAFIVGGTKATVKGLTPEHIKAFGGQAVLANTYHLLLQPGATIIEQAGGLGKFMNWTGPSFTDSGGFQVFSLGMAYKKGIDLTSHSSKGDATQAVHSNQQLAKVSDNGVSFSSHLDGQRLLMTPESSMELQHQIGADIHIAFDELTSPLSGRLNIEQAVERTHGWAIRCLKRHQELNAEHLVKNELQQALYAVVQGAREKDLRCNSANYLANLDFDGYAIGGTFEQGELPDVLSWVNDRIPADKPRHLLGMGSRPEDLFLGVEYGVDTFDCVAPTRQARNGAIYTYDGRINIKNNVYRNDFTAIDKECLCYSCQNYSRAYIAHLLRADEMLGATLASIHNEYFVVNTVDRIRQSLLDNNFLEFKESFLKRYSAVKK